jgi:peptidoglycan/xylan/chitin deacetylase (PgdA/CDA1 family)
MTFVENYKELKKKVSIRDTARSLILDGLALKNKLVSDDDGYLKKHRVQFLYIHHVFKDEEKPLRLLLDKLLQTHKPISYSNAVSKILQDDIDEPYIVFSSDDGLKNNIRAAHILKEFGISGCFFINPQIIDEVNNTKIQKFSQERLHFPPVEFMTWKDVQDLLHNGHEIGSHTMQHINIAETPAKNVFEDLAKSYEVIKKYCGSVAHFAYPYGRYFHFNETARKMVFDIGFTSCASAERGCHINPGKQLDERELFIRRDHILLHWKLSHILYFLIANSKKAAPANNFSPY